MSTPSHSDPSIIDSRFHWGLYHHLTDKNGKKYHITSVGPQAWLADHTIASNFMKSIFLIGLVRVGYCHPDHEQQMDAIVNAFPLNQEPPGYDALTCRTWTLHTVGQFVRAGVVRCQDVNALEREVLEWANQQFADASDNVQPRSIIDSRMCTFA